MNASKSKSIEPNYSLAQTFLEFNYETLNNETRMVVKQRTDDIKNLMRNSIESVMEIGRKLTEVKACLGHGNFRNWLKLEFDWSVKTASRFMQVYENCKNDNLTHLNIGISALYLLASPSVPEEIRKQVLQRSSLGEKITYTKAKTIIAEHSKLKKSGNNAHSVEANTSAATCESELNKFIQRNLDETSEKPNTVVEISGQEVWTQKSLQSSQDLVFLLKSSTERRNQQPYDDTLQVPVNTIIEATFSPKICDIMLELEMGMKKLTPEQLALVIRSSANNGLTHSHIKALIIAAQQVLTELRPALSN